jgi:hypothetical protein
MLLSLGKGANMSEGSASYQMILKQAQQLPPRVRLQLAETLLRPTNRDEQVVLISMRRLQPETQERFLELMDRQNTGELGPKDREELLSLVARYEDLLLFNTETLLTANHPELFTSSGRLRLKDLERTLRRKSLAKRSIASK